MIGEKNTGLGVYALNCRRELKKIFKCKEILSNMIENKNLFAENLTYNFTVRNKDNSKLIDYFTYFLTLLKLEEKIKIIDLYKDALKYEDNILSIEIKFK